MTRTPSILFSIIPLLIAIASRPLSAAESAEHSASLAITLVDEATGQPLPRGWATLYPSNEPRSYRNEIRPAKEPSDRLLRFAAPPGEYKIHAEQRAASLDGPQFDAIDAPESITLGAGDDRELTIKLRPRPLTLQEIDDRAPMLAIGRVTNARGEPLADVKVRVATGNDTLLGGGTTRTNAEGEYVLRFGAGIMMMDSKSQLQVAQFFVVDDRYVELSRSHEFDQMAYEISPELDGHENLDKIVVKGTPARLDFVLSEPAIVNAHFVDEAGQPASYVPVALKSPRNDHNNLRHSRSIKPRGAGDKAAATRWAVAPGQPWRFEAGTSRSPAVTYPTPGRYDVTLRAHPASAYGAPWLEIVNVTQVAELSLELAVSRDDPFAQPPLSARDRKAARQLISKMAAANERWLKGPSPEFGEFSYRFKFHAGEKRSDDVTVKPGDRQHGKQQGISYQSGIHQLVADVDIVIFRSIKADPERTAISYTFREPADQAMGTGVAGRWAGYFSRQTVNGTLVIDSQRMVPLEWYDDNGRETFSDFVEIGPDQFVPGRIQIADKGGPRFDWRFDWFPAGLWLFRESHMPEDGLINASVEEVRIGGEPAAAAQP